MRGKKIAKRKAVKKSKTLTFKDIRFPKYSVDATGITQSLIGAWMKCPFSFLLKLLKFSTPEKNNNVFFGNAVHFVLDKLYSRKRKTISPKTINKFIDELQKDKTDLQVGIDPQKIELELAMCQAVMEAYVEYYADDLTKKDFTHVEHESEVYFHNSILRRKVDGRYLANGKRWLMEHKTKGRIQEEVLMKLLSFDFQNLFYCLIDKLEFDEPLAGVLYNVVRKPQIKQKQKETLAEYQKRLIKDIASRPDFYFMRYEIPYTKTDINNFAEELKQKLNTIQTLTDKKELKQFYKCETACSNGMFTCEFLDACVSKKFTGYTKKKKIFSELDICGF